MTSTKRATIVLLLSFLFLIITDCERRERIAIIGSKAPDFTLTDLDGNKVGLSQYRGKVIVIDFWATWCPPCKDSIPFLESLYQRYKEKGLVVIGVSFDEDVELVKRFKERYIMTYPVLMGEDRIKNNYGLIAIPEMFIIGRDGVLRYHHLGFNESVPDEVEKQIKGLL